MTKKEWLRQMRQPDHCGINARSFLKQLEIPNFAAIHRKVNLNAIDASARNLCSALREARA